MIYAIILKASQEMHCNSIKLLHIKLQKDLDILIEAVTYIEVAASWHILHITLPLHL